MAVAVAVTIIRVKKIIFTFASLTTATTSNNNKDYEDDDRYYY